MTPPDAEAAAPPATPPARRRRRYRNPLLSAAAPAASALLLLGAAAYGLTLPGPGDAAPYHDAVVEAAADTPMTIGDWEGRDIDLPEEAVVLLRPNVMFNRAFSNPVAREWASFLVVQVRDSRDLLGHWPPVCYPSNGWTITDTQPRTWTLGTGADAVAVPGRRTTMEKRIDGKLIRQVCDFFLVLPRGGFVPDMQSVTDAAGRYDQRFFGAAQVQVITPARLTDDRRDAVTRELVGAHRPLLRALRGGADAPAAAS